MMCPPGARGDVTLDSALAERVAAIESQGVPPWHTLSVEAARRIEDELFTATDPPSVAAVRDLGIDGPGGNLPLRVYRPETTPAPTLVFCHGGGWTLGTLDSADGICRRLCRRVGAVVVSVDYRLAPEHPFPAALADAVSAVRWVTDHASHVGGDGTVGVAGTSAGGGLAAGVGLASARDDGPLGVGLDTELAVEALCYPALCPRFDSASYERCRDGPLLTRADMRYFWETYLRPADAANPYAAPPRANSHAGVPPTVTAVGGHDPLADDAAGYAQRLRAADVPVRELRYPSLAHGFCSFAANVPAADEAFDEVCAAIRDRFADAA